MKRFFLFLIMFNTYFQTFSQGTKLLVTDQIFAINITNQLASETLQQISDQIGYSISYNSDLLHDRPITLQSNSQLLKEVLRFIFENEELQISTIGNQLVVYDGHYKSISFDSCHHNLSGQLRDMLTKEGIPHASIKELNSNQMTVTNAEGQFFLSVPCAWDSVQLEISALGYHTQNVNQSSLKSIGEIELQGDYVTLQEVIIMSIPAEHIIDQVLNHVNDNYMNKPTNATAFYREVILKNDKIATISEAVFDTYNHPYFPFSKMDQVQLVKGRKFSNPAYIDTIDFKIKGSLASCLALDIVKHQPLFFNLESFKNHYDYSFSNVIEYDGRDIYVIDFKHRFGADGFPYHGTMYIDKEKLSLVSVEFTLNKKTMRSVENQFVVKNSKGTKTKLLNAYYHVNYTAVDERLMMSYVSFKTSFKVKKKDNLFSAQFETISEYVVNQIHSNKVTKIRPRNLFTTDHIFIDQPLTYDDDFWQGMSFLPIDKPLNDASEELKKILSVK